MSDLRRWMNLCEAFQVPKTLYHGTEPSLLQTIKREGLTAKSDTSWTEFGQGVYLAQTVEWARQYGSLVFAVDLSQLDHREMVPDDHELRDELDGEGEEDAPEDDEYRPGGIHEATWLDSLRMVGQCQYLGDIPPSALKVVPNRKPKRTGASRFNFRVDFQFDDGTRESRVFVSTDEDSARQEAASYHLPDHGQGIPKIIAIKKGARYD